MLPEDMPRGWIQAWTPYGNKIMMSVRMLSTLATKEKMCVHICGLLTWVAKRCKTLLDVVGTQKHISGAPYDIQPVL